MAAVLTAGSLGLPAAARAQQAASAPLPDVRQLMQEVQEHQKQLDKVRENYTYTSLEITEDVDAAGNVKKTETEEDDNFFVNGHLIARTVKKDGKPLTGHELDKENERVTKLVEKAEKTPPGQPLAGPSIGVSRLLEIMDVSNPRRAMFRGRPTIVFDFAGRKNAKTHGLAEDASKKLKGTIWIDEADRQVAQLEVSFEDNFRIGGGLLATIQKGSSFEFQQAPVNAGKDMPSATGKDMPSAAGDERAAANDELWLPTGGEGTMQARLMLVKGVRQRFKERDYGFKRFRVETEQTKGTGNRE
ncbi:MAG: hypothetical protein ACRD3N_03645 [Terracidiphilus sp.]